MELIQKYRIQIIIVISALALIFFFSSKPEYLMAKKLVPPTCLDDNAQPHECYINAANQHKWPRPDGTTDCKLGSKCPTPKPTPKI